MRNPGAPLTPTEIGETAREKSWYQKSAITRLWNELKEDGATHLISAEMLQTAEKVMKHQLIRRCILLSVATLLLLGTLGVLLALSFAGAELAQISPVLVGALDGVILGSVYILLRKKVKRWGKKLLTWRKTPLVAAALEKTELDGIPAQMILVGGWHLQEFDEKIKETTSFFEWERAREKAPHTTKNLLELLKEVKAELAATQTGKTPAHY